MRNYEAYFGEAQNFEFLSNQIQTLVACQTKEMLDKFKDAYENQNTQVVQ